MGTVEKGATGIITHRVKPGLEAEYERWLDEVGPISRSADGHIDWQIVRPIAGLTTTYSVILRFDTRENLTKWLGSSKRRDFIEKARPLLLSDDTFHISSGLDFLFTPEGTAVPTRSKQFLATWSALYPLSVLVPLIVLPCLRWLGIPKNRYFDIFCLNGIVVALMVYWVMPRYTKLIRRWLLR